MSRYDVIRQTSDQAVTLLRKWLARAEASLDHEKLTPQERARIGELAINAASWLASREVPLAMQARREGRGEP